LGAGALLATGVIAAFGIMWARDVQSQRCTGFEAKLNGVWDGTRRGEVQRAFLASNRSYAAASFDKLAAQIELAQRIVREKPDDALLALRRMLGERRKDTEMAR